MLMSATARVATMGGPSWTSYLKEFADGISGALEHVGSS
jgi:hypothetical protein